MARHPGFLRAGALIAAASLGLMATAAIAQEATPEATMETMGAAAHPAHIHSGTCDNLGDIVWPLSDVGVPASAEGTPQAEGTQVGAQDAIPALVGVTQLDAPLDDILNGEHAINVHESEENIQNYVACGNVGGVRYGDTVQFGLMELNGSGYTGVALLSGDPDGTSNVVVYLVQTAPGGGATGTPTS